MTVSHTWHGFKLVGHASFISRRALESVPLRKEFVPGFSLESPAL